MNGSFRRAIGDIISHGLLSKQSPGLGLRMPDAAGKAYAELPVQRVHLKHGVMKVKRHPVPEQAGQGLGPCQAGTSINTTGTLRSYISDMRRFTRSVTSWTEGNSNSGSPNSALRNQCLAPGHLGPPQKPPVRGCRRRPYRTSRRTGAPLIPGCGRCRPSQSRRRARNDRRVLNPRTAAIACVCRDASSVQRSPPRPFRAAGRWFGGARATQSLPPRERAPLGSSQTSCDPSRPHDAVCSHSYTRRHGRSAGASDFNMRVDREGGARPVRRGACHAWDLIPSRARHHRMACVRNQRGSSWQTR